MAKAITREQAERKKAKAAAFMEGLGESDRAQDFEDMSVDEYAEHKGFQLSNSRIQRKRSPHFMANGTTTKDDLQDQIDQAIDVLDDAYAPETSREDLAEAVGNALDILRGEAEEEDTDDGDDDDDGD